jgi:hypothetical protein
MPDNDWFDELPSDEESITIVPIYSTISTSVGKRTEIDPEKLKDAIEAIHMAMQKLAEDEITKALTSPLASTPKPTIKFDDNSPVFFDTTRFGLWHNFAVRGNHLSYLAPSIHGYGYGNNPPPKARTRKTTRKDGREQQTCECGCCGYPHRAGSVHGCKS